MEGRPLTRLAACILLMGTFMCGDLFGQVQSGAAFLKVLPGARQQGLAGSLAGAIDETYALYSNPGAAGFLREWQWSASYTEWIADIFNASLVYGRQVRLRTPWGNRLNFALGIHYQGIREFDSSRGAAAAASAKDILVTGSFGSPLSIISNNLSFGANLKYFRSELAQFSANAFAVDLGLLYRTPRFRLSQPGGFFDYGILSVGIAVNHLGTSLKFLNTATPLPKTWRAGMALNLGTHDGLQIQLAADYRNIRDENGRLSFGAEITNLFSPLNKGIGRLMDLRGGYNFDNNLLSKFSAGLSIRLDDYMLAPLKSVAPRNSMIRVDMSVLESSEFFAPVYRGSITHQPILPEKFEFVDPPQQSFDTSDPVKLTWEKTVDPDLYDEVGYLVLVANDSLALQTLIKDSKSNARDLFEAIRKMMLTRWEDSDGYQPAENGGPYLEEVSQNDYLVIVDSTGAENINDDQIEYLVPPGTAPGTYFWTVVAYDNNHHIRFAETAGLSVRSFKIATDLYTLKLRKPDLTLKITKTVKVIPQPALIVDLPAIVFAPDSARLEDDEKSVFKQWVNFIRKYPYVSFEISGHTDKTGPPPPSRRKKYNQRLSQKRAENILAALEPEGIDTSRLKAIGYGDTKPIDPDNSPRSWAKNRRVELRLLEDNRPPKRVNTANITYTNQGQQPSKNFSVTIFNSKEIPEALQQELMSGRFTSLRGQNGHDFSKILRELKNVMVPKLDPGQSAIIEVPCDQDRPYIIAVIDSDNQVDETNEENNWTAERIVVLKPKVDLSFVKSSKISFTFDSYELTESTKELLNKVCAILKELPEEKFEISGHTDNRGPQQYNMHLSLMRARTVKEYLISKGVDPKRLIAQGYGELEPLERNIGFAAWAKNRRVEIRPTQE
ncbi:MAG: PorV/PorQ family protein [bacterium]